MKSVYYSHKDKGVFKDNSLNAPLSFFIFKKSYENEGGK